MAKILMHIDLNAFFATAEVLRDPSLKGKPVLIGHEGRSGIVSTASYAARKYGCHSGQPMFQATELCPNAIILPPDFDYYSTLSRAFFAEVKAISPILEQTSIDEAYVDMSKPLEGVSDAIAYFRGIQKELLKKTGLPCSIGVAPTKWLAKMASDLEKPLGLVILRRRDFAKTLYPLPIESFWGIGKKTAPRLRNLGINCIGDFAEKAKADDPMLAKTMGKFFYEAKQWVLGYGDDIVSTERWDPKSVGVSETLMRDCQGLEEVRPTLKRVCEEVSRRANEEHKKGKTMTLVVKDTSFVSHSKSMSFQLPFNDASSLFLRACALYRDNYEGMEVRLVGVTLSSLLDEVKDQLQMSLWNYGEYEEKDRTKLLINDLNRGLEKPLFLRASQAKKKEK